MINAPACSLYPYQATVCNLSRSLLHLPQLGDEVPEARLGHHMVWGEDPHTVQRRSRVLGRGQQTPNNFVLPKLEAEKMCSVLIQASYNKINVLLYRI